MVKKLYWYSDGDQIISSHDIPPKGVNYIEKTISVIGIPNMRAVTIKTSNGTILYSDFETLPLEDNFIDNYFTEVNKR